jgi:hypothetical protein
MESGQNSDYAGLAKILMVLRKVCSKVWTGFVRLRLLTGDGLLRTH